MSKQCNGCGDCDICHNMNCKKWLDCEICGEVIQDDTYVSFDDCDYHKDCFLEKYEVSQ